MALRYLGLTYRQYATDASLIPRIVVPHRWVLNHEKKKKKVFTEKMKNRKINYKSPVVINCKRKVYNHHKGQSYSDFGINKLASKGWKHNKSVGDYFALEPYMENPALQDPEDAVEFKDLQLSEWLVHRLDELGLTEPTVIQKKTIPKLLQGNSTLCAAETGSGKTLAYLLPLLDIIQRLKLSQTLEEETEMAALNTPRAIILVPTRELGAQIMSVAEMFVADNTPNLALLSNEGSTVRKIMHPKKIEMDIAISTPGVLKKLLHSGVVSPRRCSHVVLDEVDTLLDDSFNSMVTRLLKHLGVHGGRPTDNANFVNTGTQLAMVGATMPKGLDDILQENISMEAVAIVKTGQLHQLMPHVLQKFVRLSESQRADEILKLAYKNHEKGVPTMIFCNKSSTVFWLGNWLDDNDIPNMVLNSQMNIRRRYTKFQKYQKEERDILICTDIASRGLDTLRVEQVINFDFPLYISDYIHRVGRVGRVGAETNGNVISFISRPWDVDLLWEIERAARKSRELQNVNANIKRKIDSVVSRKFRVKSKRPNDLKQEEKLSEEMFPG